jgi:hypothetical protein
MCASPFSLLRAGPPPPKIAVLPDGVFFTRAVTITAGATPAEAATQVELALEAVSPFPLAQLYYGWFWLPGEERAFVFAAYRRRFTSEQTADWQGAEIVIPGFATVLGAEVAPATTILLNSAEGLTALHWDDSRIPAKALFLPFALEATDDDRAKARDGLLRAFAGSKKVIELESPLQPEPAKTDREIVFRADDFVSRIPATMATAMDVRDKAELASFRSARKRDVILWRVAVGCAAALLLLIVGEFALVGGQAWQKVRLGKVRGQKSTVDRIMASQALATRIDELATKRLLPFEMITLLYEDDRKPAEIMFRNVYASTQVGIYTLTVEGFATNQSLYAPYIATLRNLPSVARVEDREFRIRNDTATFIFVVTFKPESLKPADSIVSQ